jgi:hypothetical protein
VVDARRRLGVAGSLAIALLSRAGAGVRRHVGRKVERLEREGAEWRALAADGSVIAEAPTLIVANAFDAKRLLPEARLPLSSVRGQVTFLPPSAARALDIVVSGSGYVAPLPDGGRRRRNVPATIPARTFAPRPHRTRTGGDDASRLRRRHSSIASALPALRHRPRPLPFGDRVPGIGPPPAWVRAACWGRQRRGTITSARASPRPYRATLPAIARCALPLGSPGPCRGHPPLPRQSLPG